MFTEGPREQNESCPRLSYYDIFCVTLLWDYDKDDLSEHLVLFGLGFFFKDPVITLTQMQYCI